MPSFGENENQVTAWFGSVPRSLETLFIILTLAEWDEIALMLGDVYGHWLVFPLFMAYILITAFTMVSLITGIITEKLMQIEKTDVDLRVQELHHEQDALKDQIYKVLKEFDKDDDGKISLEEVRKELAEDDKILKKLEATDVSLEGETFTALVSKLQQEKSSDDDDDESVSLNKLADGLMGLSGDARASQMYTLKLQMNDLSALANSIDEQLDTLLLKQELQQEGAQNVQLSPILELDSFPQKERGFGDTLWPALPTYALPALKSPDAGHYLGMPISPTGFSSNMHGGSSRVHAAAATVAAAATALAASIGSDASVSPVGSPQAGTLVKSQPPLLTIAHEGITRGPSSPRAGGRLW